MFPIIQTFCLSHTQNSLANNLKQAPLPLVHSINFVHINKRTRTFRSQHLAFLLMFFYKFAAKRGALSEPVRASYARNACESAICKKTLTKMRVANERFLSFYLYAECLIKLSILSAAFFVFLSTSAWAWIVSSDFLSFYNCCRISRFFVQFFSSFFREDIIPFF